MEKSSSRHRVPFRQSTRKRSTAGNIVSFDENWAHQLHYLQIAGGGVDFKALHSQVIKFSSYRQGAIRKLLASQLTPEWFRNNGTFRPVIVPGHDGKGLTVAHGLSHHVGLTMDAVVTALGASTQVHVLDVSSQKEEPMAWNLHQWQMYWERRTRAAAGQSSLIESTSPVDENKITERGASLGALPGPPKDSYRYILALPSLPIAGSSLDRAFDTPLAVQAVDLHKSLLGKEPGTGVLPHPSISLGFYPKKSFLNFTVAPAGAALWVHVLGGSASLALVPPTVENLTRFASWSREAKWNGEFLAASCEGIARADLNAGDTLLLPPGWIHALTATADTTTVSGMFLRPDGLATHLQIMRMEDHLNIGGELGFYSGRYPNARAIMWRVAEQYARILGRMARTLNIKFDSMVYERAKQMEKEDQAACAAQKVKLAGNRTAAPSPPARIVNKQKAGPMRGEERRIVKRRLSPTGSFVESDWSEGSDEDDEWVPGKGERDEMHAASDDEDDDFSDDNDEGAHALRGSGKRGMPARGQTEAQGRTSGRLQGRMPPRLAAALHEEEEGDEGFGGDSYLQQPMQQAGLKLKIKLGSLASAGVGGSSRRLQGAQSSKIKLKIKSQDIPQVDGVWEEDVDGGVAGVELELEEGEASGLAALIPTLRRWQREGGDGASFVNGPWEVLARLELGLKALKILLEPPPGVPFDGGEWRNEKSTELPLEQGGLNYQEESQSESKHEDANGDEDTSADNAFMSNSPKREEEDVSEKQTGGGGPVPSQKAPKSVVAGMSKKLSTKQRLKKKLGL